MIGLLQKAIAEILKLLDEKQDAMAPGWSGSSDLDMGGIAALKFYARMDAS